MTNPDLRDPETPPVLSIVIVSYNTRQMTLDCIASVYEQTTTPFEIVVVDNASDDGSAEAIAARFPDVVLLAETVNHGFAPAHDLAVPLTRGEWLLLLNPDTVVLDAALDKLMAFAARRPEAGIWGGRTLYGDRSLNLYSCWGRMTLWSLFCRATGLTAIAPGSATFNPEVYGDWPRDTERAVDIVTGCLFLLRRETWDRLDGFEPVFTMYGEEADLCLRARDIGARPAITPEATIVHYGGASETVRSDKMVRVLRAKAELIKRHFGAGSRGIGLWLLKVWPLSRFLALRVLAALPKGSGRSERARSWGEIWRRRAEWQDGF